MTERRWRVWVEAARVRTLPAGVAPVLVGTAAAEAFTAWRALAALVVGVAVQVAVNYANDYFDAASGVDTSERLGPRRVVAAGLVSPAAMRRALAVALAVAAVAGLALAAATTWWLLLVGLACFAAALGYSGGPRPYASAGFGEVGVFVFFGLVATVGSQFVQDERVGVVAVVAAVPVGLQAVALLVVNNLRDIPTDRAAGKMTLAVRLGDTRTRWLFVALLVAPFPMLALITGLAGSPGPLLALAVLPLVVTPVRRIAAGATGRALGIVLAGTAACQLFFALLLALGLALA